MSDNDIYLTKIKLNLRSAPARRDAANSQQMHRTLSHAFPEIPDLGHIRHRYDILYRLETDRRNFGQGGATMLVQSNTAPDWSFLPDGYTLEEIKTKKISAALKGLENGDMLLFILRANPARRVGRRDPNAEEKYKDPKRRRRVEIRGEQKQMEWLVRKGEILGFKLAEAQIKKETPNALVLHSDKIKFRKAEGGALITLATVTFEGMLEIVDADKFRAAVKKGIGTGRAYGFGLLSIANPLSF